MVGKECCSIETIGGVDEDVPSIVFIQM